VQDSLADPGPLGLAGFALTTFVLCSFNAGLISATASGVVLGLTLFYGGIAQLLAGMWEVVKGNTFGAVAFTSYGAFWMSFWYIRTHPAALGPDPKTASHAVGVFLLAWTIFTCYMFIATFKTNGALIVLFGCLFITFVFLTIGDFSASAPGTGAVRIGGWFGLITAFVAWYASCAGVLASTHKRPVLPVFPR
jgi:succinate-acetate transporter protein